MIMLNVPGTRLHMQSQMAAQQAFAIRNMDIHNARAQLQPWRDLTGLQNAYSAYRSDIALAVQPSPKPSYKARCEAIERRLATAGSFKEWQAIMGELIAVDQAQVEADIAEVKR